MGVQQLEDLCSKYIYVPYTFNGSLRSSLDGRLKHFQTISIFLVAIKLMQNIFCFNCFPWLGRRKRRKKKKAYFRFHARVSYVSEYQTRRNIRQFVQLISIVCKQNVSDIFSRRTLDG